VDTRTRYVLPPVVEPTSPAAKDPAYSSIRPACEWRAEGDFEDIRYELSSGDDAGIAKITIDRPHKRNAFRPQTIIELKLAFDMARDDPAVGVILLTGQGDWVATTATSAAMTSPKLASAASMCWIFRCRFDAHRSPSSP
jgi:hypothetical protein